jgi:hypothetical protein
MFAMMLAVLLMVQPATPAEMVKEQVIAAVPGVEWSDSELVPDAPDYVRELFEATYGKRLDFLSELIELRKSRQADLAVVRAGVISSRAEKAEQRKQAIKSEEENAGTGHGGGSFPG